MSLADMLLHVFCWVDDALRHLRLDRPRSRGPDPILSDAEVITIEVVGEFLGLTCDTRLFWHFRQHHAADFPALCRVHRTTFLRQAANLWRVKRALHKELAARLAPDDACWLADSVPVYACKFSRAKYSRLFRGQAAYGYDHAQKQTYYGFRLHARVSREGVVRAFELAPANVSDRTALPALDLPLGSQGIGDRNYWSPQLRDELLSAGIRLYAPFSSKAKDKDRARSTALSRERWLIETVQGQLAERYEVKRVRARDLWHLCHRVTRKVLSHTVAVMLCVRSRLPPLQFSRLLAA
jgi:Transposase DDE domain